MSAINHTLLTNTVTRMVYRLTLWGILLASPAWAGWWLYQDQQTQGNTWVTQAITQGDIEISIAATGTLEPGNYVDVGAQLSGQIQALHVSEGDVVTKGQLLAEIDATVFATQVKQAEASLENQRAQRIQLLAELELNKSRFERNTRLHARGAVSDDDLKSSETNIKVQEAKLAAMEASIKADEASLEGDRVTLSYAKIYAPMDGTVTSVAVREGQTLNANSSAPTLLTLSDLSQMTLRSSVSEADVHRLNAGMKVRFSTLGSPNTFYTSTLAKVLPSPTVNNDVVLYQVLIGVDNQQGVLMDGMSTQVFFIEEEARNVPMLPLAAIQQRGRQTFAKQLDAQQQVTLTPVKLGLRNRTHAALEQGLSVGDQVVTGMESQGRTQQATSLTNQGSTRIPGMPGGRRG